MNEFNGANSFVLIQQSRGPRKSNFFWLVALAIRRSQSTDLAQRSLSVRRRRLTFVRFLVRVFRGVIINDVWNRHVW